MIERGGCFTSGWALADYGPILIGDLSSEPLYSRWIHHIVWEDSNHQLWEVTPHLDICNPKDTAWLPTSFLLDRQAIPHIKPDGACVMLPSRYLPTRNEGRHIAECLNCLDRDGSRFETYWLQQAMQALKQAGFVPDTWRVEHVDGRINNVWLFADLR